MSLTTDPTHPDLCRGGTDKEPREQCAVYLVLSEEERSKGFIRPLRRSYVHVGIGSIYDGPIQMKLGKGGCGTLTKMGLALCETYARNPKFYSHTYCCGCQKHLPVGEFIWDEDNAIVGS